MEVLLIIPTGIRVNPMITKAMKIVFDMLSAHKSGMIIIVTVQLTIYVLFQGVSLASCM